MSKHKIRYILPLLAIMTSAACVGVAEPSEKAVPKVTRQKQDSKDICPQSMMKDIDRQGYECVDIFSMRLEKQLNKKYENLLHRIDSKDPKLNGVSKEYFLTIRKNWESYTEMLCSDPSVATKVRPLAGRYIRICRFEQNLNHLKALERFENSL